ncbi:MAG: prevent-host-death family protein, partial [Nostoc sp. NMS4]|nr:prevent-host-death family protein [Nostoc sp. NMS4]
VGIRKGLDEFEQGEGIPAEEALATLQHKLGIPPRP